MSREYCCATNRIVLSAQTRFFGEATATIEATGRGPWLSRRVSRIVIEFKTGPLSSKRIEVPKKALEDAGPVYVNRWEFRDEESVRPPDKNLYLVGTAPHEVSHDEWHDKILHFVIEAGEFKYLYIKVPVAKDSWQVKRFDY
jgi:hypothetical protein